MKLIRSSERRAVQRNAEALAAVVTVLTKAGVDVGEECGFVLSPSQTHGTTPGRLNRGARVGVTGKAVGPDDHTAARQPFDEARQLSPPEEFAGALTPGERHVLDRHPRWHAEVLTLNRRVMKSILYGSITRTILEC